MLCESFFTKQLRRVKFVLLILLGYFCAKHLSKMKLVLLISLGMLSLANAATIERNDDENDAIPRMVKEKENHDATQESGQPIFEDQNGEISDGMYKLVGNKYKLVDNGSMAQLIFFSATDLKIVDDAKLGRLIYFNTTNPLLYEPIESDNKSETEGKRLTDKGSDKKMKPPGKHYDTLESNEPDPNHNKYMELRTYPEIANGSHHRQVKNGKSSIRIDTTDPKYLHKLYDTYFETDERQSEELVSADKWPGKTSEISAKTYDELGSNEKHPVKDESSGNKVESFLYKLPIPRVFDSKQNQHAKSMLQAKHPADNTGHGMSHSIPESKQPEKYGKNHRQSKEITQLQDSNSAKRKENFSNELKTSVKHVKNMPSYLKHSDKGERYQNHIKSKISHLKESESVKIYPEYVKHRIENAFQIKYPSDSNFDHENKHSFEFKPRRRFSETDKSHNEYFGASKSQGKREEENLKENIFENFDNQQIRSSVSSHNKLSEEIDSIRKHLETETNGNHDDFQKPILDNESRVLNFSKIKERTGPPTIQDSSSLESQKKYSREFQPQERASNAFELQEKYPDRLKSAVKYPAFEKKGNRVNISMTVREKSTKDNIFNFKRTQGKNAITDNKIEISIPLDVEDSHKQINPLNVKNTDIEVEILMTLSLSSMKNNTHESKEMLRNEDSSEDNFNQFDKTNYRLKDIAEREKSRKNENIEVCNGSIHKPLTGIPYRRRQRRYAHKSIRDVEQLSLADLDESNEMLSSRHLDSAEGISLDEDKSIDSKIYKLRTKKSALKAKSKFDTTKELSKESKQESDSDITTEKKSNLEVDNQKTNYMTTEETTEENSTLIAEAENRSLTHSEIMKQENAENNMKIGEVKYRYNQPSEKIEILRRDNKTSNFEPNYGSNKFKAEDNFQETKKDNKTTSTTGIEHLPTNEDNADTRKQEKETKTILNRQPDEMIMNMTVMIQENSTATYGTATTFEDLKETSIKPIQEVAEDNFQETKKDNETTSTSGVGHLSPKENNTDNRKLEKAENTVLHRQPDNMIANMTTEVIIQENITANNDMATTLEINDSTTNNSESQKSAGGNPAVYRRVAGNSKLEKAVEAIENIFDEMTTEVTIEDNTTINNDSASTLQTNNNAENIPFNERVTKVKTKGKNNGDAADTLTESTTKNINKLSAIKPKQTQSTVESSTDVIETSAWTGEEGLDNQTSKDDRNVDGENEEVGFKTLQSMATVQAPKTNEDTDSDGSTNERVKNETEKQALQKENKSEVVGLAESENNGKETESEHSETATVKMDASEASNDPKEINYRHKEETKKDKKKITGKKPKRNVEHWG